MSEERSPFQPDSLSLVAAVVAMVALLGALVGIGLGMRAVDESKTENAVAATASSASPVKVSLKEFAIVPAALNATVLDVRNDGSAVHNLKVVGQEAGTPDLQPGQSARLDLSTLPAGSYKVRCDIPGHEAAGMTGSITVGDEGGATHAPAPAHAMSAEEMDEAMKARTAAFPAKTEGVGATLLEPTLVDGFKVFDLTAKIVQWEVEPGKRVEAWTYNGIVPGPTLKVEVGDKVRIILKNDLPESTVIHLHGISHLPNAMDGVPDITQPPVKSGQSFTYEFTPREPAVAMYHSHHNAAKQVSNGLLGTLLVGRMTVPAGVTVSQEVPMVLNDAGTIGLTLNGKSFPATAPIVAAKGEYVLVHYLNEGLQSHPMHLHGMPTLVVAKDGFPLAQPYLADTVNVAPGERYSVLIHATEPGTWAYHCHILTHAESEDGMFGMVTALVVK